MSTELREAEAVGTEAEEAGQNFFSDTQEKFSGEVQEQEVAAEITADDFSDLLDGIEGAGESDGGELNTETEGATSESTEAAPTAAPLVEESSADRLVEAGAGDGATEAQCEPQFTGEVKIIADTPTGPAATTPPPGTMYQGWGFISVAPPDPLAKLRQKVNQQKQAVADAHMAVMDAQELVKEVKKELEEEVEMLRGLMKELRSAEQEQEANEGGGVGGDPFGGPAGIASASGVTQETRSPVRLVESPSVDSSSSAGQSQSQEQQSPPTFEAPEPEVDEAGSRELWILSLTDSQIEKLREHDVRTVAQIEQFMREGNFVPGRIKGIGEQAINKITDSLMAYRKEHPVPQIVTADDLQCAYGAGQVAAEDGSDIGTNPHRRGTALAGAWDRGYTEWEPPVADSCVGGATIRVGGVTIQFDGDGNLSESEEEKLRHVAQCKLEMESALYGDQRYNTVNPIQPFPLPDSQ